MKTIIKNKRNYRTKIGREGTYDDNQDLPDQTHSSGSGSQQAAAAGGARGITNDGHGDHDGASDDEGGFSNSDENKEGSSSAEEDGTSSAGTKRKATGSGGSGGKGKQRKV